MGKGERTAVISADEIQKRVDDRPVVVIKGKVRGRTNNDATSCFRLLSAAARARLGARSALIR